MDLFQRLRAMSATPSAAVALQWPSQVIPVEISTPNPDQVRDLLPPAFRGAACVVQWCNEHKTGVRLWFLAESAVNAAELRSVLRQSDICADTSIYAPGVILHTCAPAFDGCNDPVRDRWDVLDGFDRVHLGTASDLLADVFAAESDTVAPEPFTATAIHPAVLRAIAEIGPDRFNKPMHRTARAIRICHPESDWPMCVSRVNETIRAMTAGEAQCEAHQRAFRMHMRKPHRPGMATLTADEVGQLTQNAIGEYSGNLGAPETVYSPPDPQLISADTGCGKSHRARHVVRNDVDGDLLRRVAIAVPDHKLSGEYQRAMVAEMGPRVGIRKGPEQPTLSDSTKAMCLRASVDPEDDSDLRILNRAGGRHATLCGKPGAWCPYHPNVAGNDGCEYQRQALGGRNVVTFAGLGTLTRPMPKDIKRTGHLADFERNDFDLLVIDEFAVTDLVGGEMRQSFGLLSCDLAATSKQALAADETLNKTLPDAVEWIGAQLTLRKLERVLRDVADGDMRNPSVAMFESEGITVDKMKDALATVGKFMIPITAGDATHRLRGDKLKAALRLKHVANRRVRAVRRVLHAAIEGLTMVQNLGERYEPIPHLRHRINTAKSGDITDQVVTLSRTGIHSAFTALPTLVLDATADPDLLAAAFPNITHALDGRAKDGGGVFRVQVRDFTGSNAQLCPGKDATDKAPAVRRQRALNVIARLFERSGPVGVIQHKRSNEWLTERGMVDGIQLGHFGAIRGQNAFENVRSLIVAGRQVPSARALEDQASVLMGRPVVRVQPNDAGQVLLPRRQGEFLMRDGSYAPAGRIEYHPDGTVEAVRRSITDAELYQAAERGRSVRRTPDNPLHLLVFSNIPMDRPVDLVVTESDVMAAGGIIGHLLVAGFWPIGRGSWGLMAEILNRTGCNEQYITACAFEMAKLTPDSIRMQFNVRAGNSDHAQARTRLRDAIDHALVASAAHVDVLGHAVKLNDWQALQIKPPGQRYATNVYVRGGVTAARTIFPDAEITLEGDA